MQNPSFRKMRFQSGICVFTVWEHVITVQFVVDLYRGDRFVAGDKPYSRFGFGDLQTEGRVSSKLNYMLRSLEIVLFVRTKKTHSLRD